MEKINIATAVVIAKCTINIKYIYARVCMDSI